MLQTQKPSLGIEELEAVKKIFQTRWLGLGSAVFEFENVIKEYLGTKNVIAVNTGTSALHLALDAFGVGKEDEVVVPSLTFCATIQAITMLGAIPVFCEIDPKTLNIDIEDAKKRITKKTKVVIPVHYCGNACDMDELLKLGTDKDVAIIEDAAHAFGSTYKGKKIGSFSNATCFSFDPIKNITCGEGGAIVLENDTIAEVIRRKRILGIDKDTWHRYQNRRSWFYEVTTQGYRYHMSNINAAIGLAQFKKLENFIEKKRKIVSIYNEKLKNLEGLKLINWNIEETAPFMYIIRVLNGKRNEMMDFLKEQGVETGIHYIPNHIQPQFSRYADSLPITEKIWTEILTLPLFYEMTDEDVDLVIRSVTSFFD